MAIKVLRLLREKYIEYSDERVTETDILNMIDSTIAIFRKIIEKKMLDEE